jgi:hypothetical protein
MWSRERERERAMLILEKIEDCTKRYTGLKEGRLGLLLAKS